MPRPRRCRRVRSMPETTYFKPAGIPVNQLEIVRLTVEEFEAVRLNDFLDIDQERAAPQMDISQPTFNRLLKSARKKIANAIVNGNAIKIEGGIYKIKN